MKLLRITAEGLPLFKDTLDLYFYAQQYVKDEHKDKLNPLYKNLYLNPTVGFIGINASGKTSVLRVIQLALDILNCTPVNYSSAKDILGMSEKTELNIYFYAEQTQEINRLQISIIPKQNSDRSIRYKIAEECLWTKRNSKDIQHRALLNFTDDDIKVNRDESNTFLPDDISIIIAKHREYGEYINTINLQLYTSLNIQACQKNILPELLCFLDPHIEYLHVDFSNNSNLMSLKLKNRKEIILSDPAELNNYLSSGTIKGIMAFSAAYTVWKNSGYLIIDEIENNLDRNVVVALLQFFMDHSINENCGTLIFSTQCPELLDEFERNDSIYVMSNQNGITANVFSGLLTTKDQKKSDAYKSGLSGKTEHDYDTYIELKGRLIYDIQ